jgi:hypothetical protein
MRGVPMNALGDLEFKCFQSDTMYGYNLLAVDRRNMKKLTLMEIKTEPWEFGQHVEPFWKLNVDEAEMLMTSLWNAGVRPLNGSGGHAETDAIHAHLEDLRKIAFHALKIEVKK